MRNARHWLGLMVVCLVVTSAASVLAQDWPQWRGAGRDGKVKDFVAPATWPATLTQVWKVALGTTDSTPALVGDKLYTYSREGDQETVSCLGAADGKILWQDKNAAPAIGGPSARQHGGPRCAPAVAEGKVVVVGIAGVISCLNAADGKLLWRKDPFPGVTPMFFTASSPLITDGMAIAYLGGPGQGALVAWDLTTGEEKWRWGAEGPDYGSPTLATIEGVKQIVTLTEKSLVGVAVADGKLLWQVAFATARMAYNAATPIVDGNTVIYSGKGRGTFAVKVAKQGDAFAATQLWANADVGVQFSSPVLQDGLLFGLSDRGNLFCLNAETGKLGWSDAVQRDRGGFGPVVAAGPAIFCLPSSGQLTAFKADGAEYAQLAQYKVSEGLVFGHPIIAGNRVFVQDQASVALWTMP